MNKKKIFLAAPISGFSDDSGYQAYRKNVIDLIGHLRKNNFDVFSEVEQVTGKHCYDSPEISAINDFQKIDNSDIFLMLHPQKIQTSSLIELGYAYAKEKALIIVGSLSTLPYLAIGLPAVSLNINIINSSVLDSEVFSKIVSTINSF